MSSDPAGAGAPIRRRAPLCTRPRCRRLPGMRTVRLAAWVLRGSSLLLLLACDDRRAPFTAPEPETQTALAVRMHDSATGRPILGAQVFLQRLPDTSLSRTARIGAISDSSGLAVIDTVAPGRYRLHIRRIGYQRAERDLELHELRSPAPIAVAVTAAVPIRKTCVIVREELGGRSPGG